MHWLAVVYSGNTCSLVSGVSGGRRTSDGSAGISKSVDADADRLQIVNSLFARETLRAVFQFLRHANSVRLSVCPSVTRVLCVKTAEPIIKIPSLSDRPIILGFLVNPKYANEYRKIFLIKNKKRTKMRTKLNTRSTQRAQTSAERQHNRIAEWFLQCKWAMQLWSESTGTFSIIQWIRISDCGLLYPDADPDRHQNWTNWSLGHALPLQEISSKSVHNFFSYPTDRQTDKQTEV